MSHAPALELVRAVRQVTDASLRQQRGPSDGRAYRGLGAGCPVKQQPGGINDDKPEIRARCGLLRALLTHCAPAPPAGDIHLRRKALEAGTVPPVRIPGLAGRCWGPGPPGEAGLASGAGVPSSPRRDPQLRGGLSAAGALRLCGLQGAVSSSSPPALRSERSLLSHTGPCRSRRHAHLLPRVRGLHLAADG
ncbi:hypothetical protein NDU88_005583 [Pleurodeles waltl]|uniref:Uncharacterized protein n=1 Tax=Pleurodeles waltl TaxID=8319 RepID=A0AAV7PJB1_PLEWA|nr:hypothetical protein NDU88_005583 [Pleurodeles waltl]